MRTVWLELSDQRHQRTIETHGVLVLHVGAEGVRGAVDLAALGARPRVRGAHAHHVQLARN